MGAPKDEAGLKRQLSPHDKLFKRTFSEPENVVDLLKANLPPAVVSRLDWSHLRKEPGSYVDESLAERFTDLLFSVPFGGRTGFVYLLLDHKSAPDSMTAYQLIVYCVRIWEDWRGKHPGVSTIPAILPLVIHHSENGWSGPRDLADLFNLDAETLEVLRPFLPSLHFLVDDLSDLSDAELKKRARTAFALLTLRLLVHARHSPDLVADMKAWIGTFRKLLAAPNGLAALAILIQYILLAGKNAPIEKVRNFVALLGPRAQEVYMSAAEEIRQEVSAQVLAKGKGDDVVAFLEARGLTLSDEQRERILSTRDLDTLDRWVRRAATIESTDQLFE